ncbi:MAG: hypothetical protein ACOYI2_11075 [Bacillota bacterium]|jgi:hypothetical protein|nr:hypothetical protein [Clostridia bacterium]
MTQNLNVKKEDQGFVIYQGKTIPVDTASTNFEDALKTAFFQSNGNNAVSERVAVQFTCGACCKRISEADFALQINGILLVGTLNNKCMLVETLCEGKVVDKELTTFAIVALDRVCAFELYSDH